MKKIIVLLLFFVVVINSLFSQENKTEFKPNGKTFIKVFTNYNTSFNDEKTHSAFEIQRAYLGYAFKLSKEFSGKVTLDVGNPKDDGKFMMTAYLKSAYFQYKKNGLKIKFGLIGRYQFKMQETLWGGRYLYKSYMDEYKFGSSADIGTFITYKINDMISIDASVENGEGYKSTEIDSIFKYSGGITITPIKGLNIRGYTDYMGEEDAQQTYAGYVGYSLKNFKIGAEYNYQINNKSKKNHDWGGYSFYVSYKTEKFKPFIRYDKLESTIQDGETDPFNYDKDGQIILAGLEFSPLKGIKITPNYRVSLYDNGEPERHSIYLSCEIKF